jgi:hypothetical protein
MPYAPAALALYEHTQFHSMSLSHLSFSAAGWLEFIQATTGIENEPRALGGSLIEVLRDLRGVEAQRYTDDLVAVPSFAWRRFVAAMRYLAPQLHDLSLPEPSM